MRKLARSVRETLELPQPEARLVGGRPAARSEIAVLTASVERITAQADREHLERELGLEIDLHGLAAILRFALARLSTLAHVREDVGGRLGDVLPGAFEIGVLDAFDRRTCREQRAPQPEREGTRAPFDRVHS